MKCQHCYEDIYYYGIGKEGNKLYLLSNKSIATAQDFFCSGDLKVRHTVMPIIKEVSNG